MHKAAIFFKVIFTVTLLLLYECNAIAQVQKVWIDADSGNETDDIYAIVRLLKQPSIEVVGISSAHFNNADLIAFEKWNQYDTKNINTVQISQTLNEDVLKVMGKLSIPHPIGADRQMGRAWGGRQPRSSDASKAIIATVKKLAPNEKLVVINLGALTNIASAIALDTTIVQHIICYALGAKYDVKNGVWNKSEFNIRNDLNAFDYLLDFPSLELVMMPINVASVYQFERDDLYKILREEVPVEKMLKQRWQETNPQDAIRTLWDLALVEAFLNEQFTTSKYVLTPPENVQRMLKVYTNIESKKIKDDFFQNLKVTEVN